MIEQAVPEPVPADPPVVVGVGTEEVGAALRYAVDEALRVGCPLHLVHVVPVVPLGSESALASAEQLDKIGTETLALAAERAEEMGGGVLTVVEELRRGPVVPGLVAAAREARMLVLEYGHPVADGRPVTRTVAGGVAAQTLAPVVAVPSGWSTADAEQVVVAGVDAPIRAGEVLRAAVDRSRDLGTGLRVVHAWSLPEPYESLHSDTAEDRRWGQRARAEIRAALEEIGEGERVVHADVVAHRGREIDALLQASDGAALLVIGRHDPVVPVGSHVGPVAREVLRQATCPVLLAAPSGRR
ncbi:universal stress protein [Nocardioides sp. J2M5]|uniref:universal stress protein n=1 Tax=Nocardioides palaemonis TaxID=2829810 RepID=UPI001BA73CAB|nr:universal stress protein [Nocardioides palaemonis]MBS2937168.1 universal stress protein [Nocardioides palaemonis]